MNEELKRGPGAPSQDFFSGKKGTNYSAGTSTIPAHTDPRLAQHMQGLQRQEAMKREAQMKMIEKTRREAPALEETLYNEEDLG